MPLTCTDILTQTPQGLYCRLGGFHLDPLRPVPRALVTHGHSDHARAGHGSVMATAETLGIMAVRYGDDFAGATQTARLDTMRLGDVSVRFVPAGHVLGSAQIVIESGGCRGVVSGDYKRAADPTCLPFEPVPCDVFITEATFGLPVFRHPDVREDWSRRFPDPVTCFASGWMRVRARARQKGVELPLVISDHADWDALCATIHETGAGEVWVTHGQEDALVHWCGTQGIRARPLHLLGYGDEGEAETEEVSSPQAAQEETSGEAP